MMPSKKSKKSDDTQARGCEIMKGSAAALKQLRSLPSTAVVLLLTPVMSTAEQIDPFEPLGRAISKYHARVRHVPYIAKIGLTDTHHLFMEQANVVIVASIDSPPSIIKEEDSDMADSMFEFVVESANVPVVHIQFGSSTKVSENSHEICVRASHATPEMFAWATCLLFGQEE